MHICTYQAMRRRANRRYYLRNKDKPEFKEKKRRYSREYYQRNKEAIKAKRREYYYNIEKPRECGIIV